MAGVVELYLNGNELRDTIPTEIANLDNLQALSLETNRLNGEIPTHIGLLQSIRKIKIDHNGKHIKLLRW